jgi:hypothetical protein
VVSLTDPYGRILCFLDRAAVLSSKYLLSCTHEAKWTPFQTHYFSENLVVPGIEPGPLDLLPGPQRLQADIMKGCTEQCPDPQLFARNCWYRHHSPKQNTGSASKTATLRSAAISSTRSRLLFEKPQVAQLQHIIESECSLPFTQNYSTIS